MHHLHALYEFILNLAAGEVGSWILLIFFLILFSVAFVIDTKNNRGKARLRRSAEEPTDGHGALSRERNDAFVKENGRP